MTKIIKLNDEDLMIFRNQLIKLLEEYDRNEKVKINLEPKILHQLIFNEIPRSCN